MLLGNDMMDINGKDNTFHLYYILNADTTSFYFVLAEEKKGKLASLVEKEIECSWEKRAKITPVSDVRFDIWVKKLRIATGKGMISWRNYGDTYYGDYCEIQVCIEMNKENDPCWTSGEANEHYIFQGFTIGFDLYNIVQFRIRNEMDKLDQLQKLIDEIHHFQKIMDNLVNRPDIDEIRIQFADVMVISHSMFCKNRDHHIIPCRGVVEILTKDNKIEEYTIYVGYCKTCNIFTVFQSDYSKMLEKGNPMCTVYTFKEFRNTKKETVFRYKSQSVLAAKGYNVQANNLLTDEERQKLLKECLDDKVVEVHDLIDFLEWLVRTREPLPKYENAIRKWKYDIEYIKHYKEEERDRVKIESISVK